MIKNLLFAFLMILPASLLAQDQKASLTNTGVTPVVYDLSDKPASEIYTKVIEWINLKYNSPKDVLKGGIQDKFVSLNGFMDNAWSYSTLGMRTSYGITYKLDIDIKENRYRASFILNDFTHPTQAVYYGYESMFKKDGSVKKVYIEGHKELEASINTILQDLYKHINGESSRDDEW
ncbi:DUF4468 domain-containing protein [Myroides fluvii]|uniref:DUF4468 domain-containing protein n=1 Tax=Myroides fluvii TaxID=2572594 RepID=UPI00131C4BEE|nr:DUF4468 domain-containing protein [Myroides fluvii]